MQHEDFATLFRHKLRELLRQKKKYQGRFNAADEERLVRAFETALDAPRISETALLEDLSGKESL